MLQSATPSPERYAVLGADLRYEKLDNDLSPTDVPDFRAEHTNEHDYLDAAECISAMAEWLDDRINAGEPHSPYTNDDYQSITTRSNIKHWEYSKSPVLPHPRTMDGHGASCIRVSLKGTVDPDTRYDDPKPKTPAYQHLWNVVTMFAHATDAEVRLTHSQKPRDDLKAYLFYDL